MGGGSGSLRRVAGTGPKVAPVSSGISPRTKASPPRSPELLHRRAAPRLPCEGLAPGDEVITTPMTFCATVNTIVSGRAARPRRREGDTRTSTRRCCARSRRGPGRSSRAFRRRPCSMDALQEIAREYDLRSRRLRPCDRDRIRGAKPARWETSAASARFDEERRHRRRRDGAHAAPGRRRLDQSLGLHGMSKDAWSGFSDEGFKHYDVVAAGFKYNMMDLQAAIGIHQLARVEEYWSRRERVWERYNEAFRDLPLGLPAPVEPETRHAYHLYTLLVDEERTGIHARRVSRRHERQKSASGPLSIDPGASLLPRDLRMEPREYPEPIVSAADRQPADLAKLRMGMDGHRRGAEPARMSPGAERVIQVP